MKNKFQNNIFFSVLEFWKVIGWVCDLEREISRTRILDYSPDLTKSDFFLIEMCFTINISEKIKDNLLIKYVECH